MIRYVINGDTYEGDDSSKTLSFDSEYELFQFSNDGANDITINIKTVSNLIDDFEITIKENEQFNFGEKVTKFPKFNEVEISQSGTGSFRIWFLNEVVD